MLEVTLNKEKCRIALQQSYARIVCLLMFWLPDQGLHSLRVCHCSRLKAWCVLIAKLLRTHCFSCGLKIPLKLFKTARGHLQTFQWNTFFFFFWSITYLISSFHSTREVCSVSVIPVVFHTRYSLHLFLVISLDIIFIKIN